MSPFEVDSYISHAVDKKLSIANVSLFPQRDMILAGEDYGAIISCVSVNRAFWRLRGAVIDNYLGTSMY